MKNLKHEYDGRGNHRIVNSVNGEAGDWTGYQAVATFFDNDKIRLFIAVSNYHGSESPANGTSLRPDIVYLVTPQAHVTE